MSGVWEEKRNKGGGRYSDGEKDAGCKRNRDAGAEVLRI